MDIVWDSGHSNDWDALHASRAGALQQHFAFGLAMQALGTHTERVRIHQDGQLIGLAQFVVRRFGGLLGLALCSRGPLWREDVSAEQQRLACKLIARSLPQRWPRAVLFAPEGQIAKPGTDSGQPSAPDWLTGLTRVITGDATVIIDLTRSEADLRAGLHPKWRNRLVAAERSELKVTRVGEKLAQYRWLLDREGLQRQERAYRALPSEFVPAYQAAMGARGPALLTVRADLGRDAVAAMMFLIHGHAATYHVGWSNSSGRELSAHNLVLWRALPLLKALQIKQLDLGGVNTQRGANLARFKLGSGGSVQMNPGTFI